MNNLVFVDCEANGPCPTMGELTEFGAVLYPSKKTFHGVIYESSPNPNNPAKSLPSLVRVNDPKKIFLMFETWLKENVKGRPILVSDNPAYDFQWINFGFWTTIGRNPFGHSARRISDFYAGLQADFTKTQGWKKYRITPHDHNPINDAMGNVEAFEQILKQT